MLPKFIKQATAVATLSPDGTINSISITEPNGYEKDDTTLTVPQSQFKCSK